MADLELLADVFRKEGYAVLDSNGKPAAEDTAEGFSEETIRLIREYI